MEKIEEMPQINVVAAVAEDARGIQELMHKSVLKTYVNGAAGITPDDIEDFYKNEFTPEGLAKLENNLSQPEAGVRQFVAKENGVVVGYCRVRENPETNLLARIHVLPDKKHSGIGSRLWNQAQDVLNPHKDTELYVVDYNTDAIMTYRKWGFAETEKRNVEPMKSGSNRVSVQMILKSPHAPSP